MCAQREWAVLKCWLVTILIGFNWLRNRDMCVIYGVADKPKILATSCAQACLLCLSPCNGMRIKWEEKKREWKSKSFPVTGKTIKGKTIKSKLNGALPQHWGLVMGLGVCFATFLHSLLLFLSTELGLHGIHSQTGPRSHLPGQQWGCRRRQEE